MNQRVRLWIGRLADFASREIVFQALTLCAGLVIVRLLPKADYALYTIAIAMQSAMSTLSDSGLSSGLSAIGGPIFTDRAKLSSLVVSALRLRRWIAAGACLVVIGPLVFGLLKNGASAMDCALLSLLVVGGFYTQATLGLLSQLVRLSLAARWMQNLNIVLAGFRLCMLVAVLHLTPTSIAATAVSLSALVLQVVRLRKRAAQLVDLRAAPDEAFGARLRSIVGKQAPMALYSCVYGQITIWLLATLGTASAVADLGALGRLGMIFQAITSVMTTLIYPRFARLADPHMLRRRYLESVYFFLGSCGLILILVALAPNLILMLLGPKYMNLQHEVLLVAVSSILSALLTVLWLLNASRGWIPSPFLFIPIGLSSQALCAWAINVSTVGGALHFSILSVIPNIFLMLFISHRGIARSLHASSSSGEPVK